MQVSLAASRAVLAGLGLHAAAVTARNCVLLDIPVSVSAINSLFDTLHIDSNIDAAEFTIDVDKWTAKTPDERNLGPLPISGTYTISAQLCVASGPKAGILQIATHGAWLNKLYWDIPYQDYSYVNAALAAGYSILTYDRLGVGNSSKPDGYTELQTPLEGAVLTELTRLSLSGELVSSSTTLSISGSGVPADYTAADIVQVGHSYGSLVINWLLGQPGGANLSSAALLTGFVVGPKFQMLKLEVVDPVYAHEKYPTKFADRGSGYFTFGSRNAFQVDSLRKETLDPAILDVWEESLIDTFAVGEVNTLGMGYYAAVKDVEVPILMFIGEYDFAFCSGDCHGAYSMDEIHDLYPNVTDVEVYLQPGTSHGGTLFKNATAGYQVMFSYLDRFGL